MSTTIADFLGVSLNQSKLDRDGARILRLGDGKQGGDRLLELGKKLQGKEAGEKFMSVLSAQRSTVTRIDIVADAETRESKQVEVQVEETSVDALERLIKKTSDEEFSSFLEML